MIRLPLLRATLRSYRNRLRRAHRRNPAAVNALALVSVLAYLALMAVQTQTTEILSQFPTKAAKEPASPPKTTEAKELPLF